MAKLVAATLRDVYQAGALSGMYRFKPYPAHEPNHLAVSHSVKTIKQND